MPSYPNLPSITNASPSMSAVSTGYNSQNNISFVTATNPYCAQKQYSGSLGNGKDTCQADYITVQTGDVYDSAKARSYENYWCLGSNSTIQNSNGQSISGIAPAIIQTQGFDLNNYSPSYNWNHFPNNGSLQPETYNINGNSYYSSVAPICPLLGGQPGTFTTTDIPAGTSNINTYVAQDQNGNSWCQNSPNSSNFNIPCQYNGSSQNIVNNWTYNDLFNYAPGSSTYPLQPYPQSWPTDSTSDVFSGSANSSNQTSLNNLVNAGAQQLCASLTNNCDPKQYNATGVCPIVDSLETYNGNNVADTCQSYTNISQNSSTSPSAYYANLMNTYCQGPNLLNNACQNWCTSNSPLADCGTALTSFCSDDTVAEQNPSVCACFRSQAFYNNISSPLVDTLLKSGYPQAIADEAIIQPCQYNLCSGGSSKYNVKYSPKPCPSTCFQGIQFNNSGTIVAGSVNMQQSASCLSYNKTNTNADPVITPASGDTNTTPADPSTNYSLPSSQYTPTSSLPPSPSDDAAKKRKRNIIIGASVAGGVTILALLMWLLL